MPRNRHCACGNVWCNVVLKLATMTANGKPPLLAGSSSPFSTKHGRNESNMFLYALLGLTGVLLFLRYHRAPVQTCAVGSRSLGLPGLVRPSYDISSQAIRPMISVMTRSNSSAVRQAIRDSWAKDRRLAKVMFFSMRPKSEDSFRELRAESVKYHDLVIVSHAIEGINSSADATLHMLKAAVVLGSEITHVVKMDEDCFVHIENLIDALADAPKQWMYGGNPFITGDTLEKHKSQEPGMNLSKSSWPPSTVLPAYAAGYGVAFTLDLVKHMAAGAHMTMPPTNPIWLEDAATGIWVKFIGQEQQVNINYHKMPFDHDGCSLSSAVMRLDKRTFPSLVEAHRCLYSGDCAGRCVHHHSNWPAQSRSSDGNV